MNLPVFLILRMQPTLCQLDLIPGFSGLAWRSIIICCIRNACRYEQYTARSGQVGAAASELPSAAVKAALRYVQQYNAHALLAGAQRAASEALTQTIEVSFTRQYEQLAPAPGGAGGGVAASPAEALYETLMACLEVV